MTETHKAAVEALEAMPSNRIYGGIKSSTQFKKELGEWAFNNLDTLRTLKQPSSVEVTELTAEEAAKACIKDWCSDYFPMVLQAMKNASEYFPHGLRITRAAATDGVKS